MLITPLQYLLRSDQLDDHQLRAVVNVSRTTLWRWAKGVSFPQEPQKLIDYCSTLALFIEGEKYSLDYNGIFNPSISLPDFFCDVVHIPDPHVPLAALAEQLRTDESTLADRK